MKPSDLSDETPVRVPEEVVAEAKSVFERRSNAEVATLFFDSLVDGEGATAADHWLRFGHRLVQINVHVSATQSGAVLTGRVEPPLPEHVELHLDGADVSLGEDVVGGEFSFDQIPHGLTRLALVGPTQMPAVRTDWFRV